MLRASKWRQMQVCGRRIFAPLWWGIPHRMARRLSVLQLAAALILAGCHQAPATTANGSSAIPTIVGLIAGYS
jgi:hypothetical protein